MKEFTDSRRRHFYARYLSGAALAHSTTARARSRGELPDPRSALCVDCGRAATEYDHRDYNEPLKVDPVCRGCNARRGKAKPKQWAPGEWAAYIASQQKLNLSGGRKPQVVALNSLFQRENAA